MDIIYKVLIIVLGVALLISGGYALMMNHSNDIAVNNYFEAVTQTIIESDYNDGVIEACIEEAENLGYALTVDVHGNGKAGAKKYAVITLSYTSEIKLFDVSLEKVKQKVI